MINESNKIFEETNLQKVGVQRERGAATAGVDSPLQQAGGGVVGDERHLGDAVLEGCGAGEGAARGVALLRQLGTEEHALPGAEVGTGAAAEQQDAGKEKTS